MRKKKKLMKMCSCVQSIRDITLILISCYFYAINIFQLSEFVKEKLEKNKLS